MSQTPVDSAGRLCWTVSPEDADQRIDRALGRLLAPDYSRSYLAALVDEGTITVNGVAVRPSFLVPEGAVVEGELGRSAASLPGPEPMALSILYEDDQLLVVDKPVGLVIHPGSGAKEGTLINGLLHRYPELATVGRADRPGIVHRLDRETSGVLVVARTNDAARSLVGQFKDKAVRKEYDAVVWGTVPFDSDWIDLPIGAHPRRPQMRAVDKGPEGKPSATFYEVRERLGVATHLACFPRTGRTHQIRVHLDHIGFPILGDPQYGAQIQVAWARWKERRQAAGEPVPSLARQALHARVITLQHPTDGREVSFSAPRPADLEELLRILRAAGPDDE